MADLIAQGAESHQRWRKTLRLGERIVLGRDAGPWSAPWDEHMSRQHAELVWANGRLDVKQLPTGRNPMFVAGEVSRAFGVTPGEHFVIGRTTFTLSTDQVNFSLELGRPAQEQTYTAQDLRRVRFHDPDQRIEVLTRLPEVISGAASDTELFSRLVSVLLAGVPRASAIVLAAADGDSPRDAVRVLHWDRRMGGRDAFQPSQRLIVEAVQLGQSVLHVWNADPRRETAGARPSPAFTLSEEADWAFCTPVLGDACRGWGIYVAGRFAHQAGGSPTPTDSTDLREDIKFTELAAATLSSLRQLHLLQRRQSALSRFFAPAVLDAMSATDPELVLAPREADVAILFCDLRGFSLETEKNAGDLLGLLNRVSQALGVMTHHILSQGGVFGDFQGDAAMGFWGWPIAQADDIERACRAALAIRREFAQAASLPGSPLANFRVGIGLAAGRAVAGRIGTTDQVKVTVFGPVANLASRLEGMTKILHTPILIDEAVAKRVRAAVSPSSFRCRRLAVVKPFGLDTPVEIGELLPPASEYPELSDEHVASYEAALDAFGRGEWTSALEHLHRVPATDRVKDFLTVYIAQHNRVPPPGFTGVIALSSKG